MKIKTKLLLESIGVLIALIFLITLICMCIRLLPALTLTVFICSLVAMVYEVLYEIDKAKVKRMKAGDMDGQTE